MPRATTAAVILAAGKGTRFRSERAKVLHRAAGRSLLGHVLEALRPLKLGQIIVVVGHQREDVEAEAASLGIDNLTFAVQEEQHGTGHAAAMAMPVLDEAIERVMVLPGDTPLLSSATLALLADTSATAGMLTFVADNPTGYGRIVRRSSGEVHGIVEDRDASSEQRSISECNAGMYAFSRSHLANALPRLKNDNDQGEVYLTDVLGLFALDGREIVTAKASEHEVGGVNDRVQLADAEALLRRRTAERLMRDGVSIVDPATTYLDVDVEVGVDTTILPGCIIADGTRIGRGATIGPNCHLVDTIIDDGALVRQTVAESARIGPDATVGPFTYLRPGTRLERGSKAGGFVEMKNAQVGEGSKVPHLSYVGDAIIGRGVNLSAGAITVNYDGTTKHMTTIEDGAFVGCDTMLVAPVTIGAGSFVAAGSTITDDVPADALAIARARQVVKDGWAAARRDDD